MTFFTKYAALMNDKILKYADDDHCLIGQYLNGKRIMDHASCVLVYEQKEMYLDEALVVQQLRYTGMLETVRIRRSGYGAKYTFQVLYSSSS